MPRKKKTRSPAQMAHAARSLELARKARWKHRTTSPPPPSEAPPGPKVHPKASSSSRRDVSEQPREKPKRVVLGFWRQLKLARISRSRALSQATHAKQRAARAREAEFDKAWAFSCLTREMRSELGELEQGLAALQAERAGNSREIAWMRAEAEEGVQAHRLMLGGVASSLLGIEERRQRLRAHKLRMKKKADVLRAINDRSLVRQHKAIVGAGRRCLQSTKGVIGNRQRRQRDMTRKLVGCGVPAKNVDKVIGTIRNGVGKMLEDVMAKQSVSVKLNW